METHDHIPTEEGTDRRSTTTYRRDPEESPAEGVVSVVAAVTGADPTRMEPLYEAIDPDALDRVFDSTGGDPGESPGTRVRFRYRGCVVTVHGDGRIVVSRIDPD